MNKLIKPNATPAIYFLIITLIIFLEFANGRPNVLHLSTLETAASGYFGAFLEFDVCKDKVKKAENQGL